MPALLLAAILVLGTAAHGQEPPARRSLAGRLLVATEALRDPRFAKTVIYVVRHNADGALGLVVNWPITDVPYDMGPLAVLVGSHLSESTTCL